MRLPTNCWECVLAWKDGDEPPATYLLDLRDDGAYQGECAKGHEIKFALQNLHYELLYESGIVALFCGFHSQAVTSIVTALERFFEFAIYVFAAHQGVEAEKVEVAWKEVANQTERQLGAFMFLYLTNMKKPFETPDGCRSFQEMNGFRNGVVHKGKIPTHDAAKKYAREVYMIVRAVRDELDALDAAKLDEVEARLGAWRGHRTLLEKGKPKPGKDGMYRTSTASFAMMLSDVLPKDFESRLAMARENLSVWGHGNCGSVEEVAEKGGERGPRSVGGAGVEKHDRAR